MQLQKLLRWPWRRWYWIILGFIAISFFFRFLKIWVSECPQFQFGLTRNIITTKNKFFHLAFIPNKSIREKIIIAFILINQSNMNFWIGLQANVLKDVFLSAQPFLGNDDFFLPVSRISILRLWFYDEFNLKIFIPISQSQSVETLNEINSND